MTELKTGQTWEIIFFSYFGIKLIIQIILINSEQFRIDWHLKLSHDICGIYLLSENIVNTLLEKKNKKVKQ